VTSADAVAQTPLHFDIPAQPLSSALESYGAFTDVSLLYDSALTAGRIAAPVQGDMTARAALLVLLEGSGLTPRYTSVKTVALVPVRAATPGAAADAPAAQAIARRYFGLIQTRVHDAFCAQPMLAQGTRRIALRLWIDASGEIGPVTLLGSSGDKTVDALVISSLQGTRVGEPVPPTLAQPFTFVVLPRASGRNWACAPANDPSMSGGQHGR
jgi:hypothetical protein